MNQIQFRGFTLTFLFLNEECIVKLFWENDKPVYCPFVRSINWINTTNTLVLLAYPRNVITATIKEMDANANS